MNSSEDPTGRGTVPAAEVARPIQLGAAARALLADGLTPPAFLDLLLAAGELVDACRFLAHLLPRREAVWWACLCIRRVETPAGGEDAEAPLRAAEQWVADPSEDHRWAARRSAEAVELSTPAA